MKHGPTLRLGVAIAALALTATACGGSRSEAPQPTDTGGGGGSVAPTADKFGTLDSPCGSGDASSAPGDHVTASTITIGYGDDRGFAQAPGLNQSMGDAVAMMIKWCNDQGGIDGRKIEGIRYDGAYTNAPQVMQKACSEVFMLVGEGFAYDEAAEQIRVGCNLPVVPGFVVGPNASMGPMKYEPVPYPVDKYNTANLQGGMEVYPNFKTAMDLVNSDSPAVKTGTAKVQAALETLGVTPLNCGVELSSKGNANYVPFVQRMEQCGVKAFWTNESPKPSYFSFLETMQRQNYNPDKVFEATWYSDFVAKWNTGAGDGITTGIIFQPFENADHVPAVKQYVDLATAAGAKTDTLGMQATSAFLLWATAAKACGDDLTRQCMVNELSKVHEWTGGGLHTTTDPGANLPAKCALEMQLKGNTWSQVLPKELGEFFCPPNAVVDLPESTWGGVKLNDQRISTQFLTPNVITPQS